MGLRNNYSDLGTAVTETPYVLPPFPCGWYEHTGPYGDKTVYQFRRMPRAGKYTGRYGLWLKDPDAGMVLIGVVIGKSLEPEGLTYRDKFNDFLMGCAANALSVVGVVCVNPTLAITKRTCSWCGRELSGADRLCHDTPKCPPAPPGK
jgi:hypothetical protein